MTLEIRIAIKGDANPATVVFKFRRRQTSGLHTGHDFVDAASPAFYESHTIEYFGDIVIAWFGMMFLQKSFERPPSRQQSLVPQFHAIIINLHLNMYAGVVFVDDGVEDGLPQRILRDFQRFDALETLVMNWGDQVL